LATEANAACPTWRREDASGSTTPGDPHFCLIILTIIRPTSFKSSAAGCLVLLALFVAPYSVPAPDTRFERLGPFGGTVRALLISSSAGIAYLGTQDGQLLKSADGGKNWDLLYPGLKRRQFVIDTIVEHPSNPNHIYAGGWDVRSDGGGLYETRDGGKSWVLVALPKPNAAVRGFAISRGNPGHMIVGTNAGIFVTSNAGKTWEPSGSRMDAFLQAESVAIDPKDPRFLFAGTWHLGYRSSDSGKTWIQNARGMIPDSDIFSITIDERNPNDLYASACTGLYRSTNRGISWTRLKVFPKSYLVRAHVVTIDPADSRRVYGGTTEGLFLSADAGKSWTRVTPAGWVIHAVQVDRRSGSILIGTERHGVLRSEDGGRNWTESNHGYVGRSIARIIPDPVRPGRLIVGEVSEGKAGGFHVYDNPVNGWLSLKASEIPGEGLLSMLDLPGDRGRLAGTSRGVFIRRPESGQWAGLPGMISKLAVYDLAFDSNREHVFAGTNDGVYRARLPDLMFERPRNYAFIPRVFALLAAPDGIVFAGSHLGVLRSVNHGDTWTFSSDGIPDRTIVHCLAQSPADSGRIFAGTSAGLFLSKDGGKTWGGYVDGRLGVDIPSLIFLNSSGSRLAAADHTYGGVFLSTDGGAHWDKFENQHFGSPVRSLAQDPAHPEILYLGTATEGVYRLTLPDLQTGPDKR